MHGLAESGPAENAGLPFVLLHQAALCAYLAEHRQPWSIRVHEHALSPIIDLKPSLAGWADSRAGIVTDFGLSAEWADHLIPLASVSIIGRTLWSLSPITLIVKGYQPLDTTRDWCDLLHISTLHFHHS